MGFLGSGRTGYSWFILSPPKFTLAVDLDHEYIPIDEFLANF